MANDSGCWKKWHSYCVMYWMARKQYHWKWPVVDKDVGWLLELQCTSLFVMILEVTCCWQRCGMITGAPMHFTFCYDIGSDMLLTKMWDGYWSSNALHFLLCVSVFKFHDAIPDTDYWNTDTKKHPIERWFDEHDFRIPNPLIGNNLVNLAMERSSPFRILFAAASLISIV